MKELNLVPKKFPKSSRHCLTLERLKLLPPQLFFCSVPFKNSSGLVFVFLFVCFVFVIRRTFSIFWLSLTFVNSPNLRRSFLFINKLVPCKKELFLPSYIRRNVPSTYSIGIRTLLKSGKDIDQHLGDSNLITSKLF